METVEASLTVRERRAGEDGVRCFRLFAGSRFTGFAGSRGTSTRVPYWVPSSASIVHILLYHPILLDG